MPETAYSHPRSTVGSASYGALLTQTMFLVAVAIGFFVAGSVVGQDLSRGAAFAMTIGAIAVLFVQNFIPSARSGPLGMGFLFVAATMLGLGLAPALDQLLQVQPDAVTNAGATTALVVVAAGAGGSLIAKDLASWAKPLSIAILIAVVISWAMLVFGGTGGVAGSVVSLAIGAISALLIVVYFNVLRKHATEDDVVWIATGIFIGIYNIFVSALSLFSNR